MSKALSILEDVLNCASRIPAADQKPHPGRSRGRKTKLPITRFIINLFIANEQRYQDMLNGKKDDKKNVVRPLTNNQLKAAIITEYAHQDETMVSFDKGNQSIEKLRVDYLNGNLCKSSFPEDKPGFPPVFVFRYNTQGQICKFSSRRGDTPMTNGDIKDLVEKRSKVQETFEQVMTRLHREKKDWKKRDAVA